MEKSSIENCIFIHNSQTRYKDFLDSRVSLGVFEYNCVEKQIFTHCHILGSGKCKQKKYFIVLYSVQFNLLKSI